MSRDELLIKKYFEILKSNNYDEEELNEEEKNKLGNVYKTFDIFLKETPREELELIIKQFFKRHFSQGQGLFEEDDILDELEIYLRGSGEGE